MDKGRKILKSIAVSRAPIVAVLGHVDHGKTSLLDKIRGTKTAEGEEGGITQGIGAFKAGGVTFIDTPGHEAFSKMRSRGGQAADIVLLVIDINEGVMPQTLESLEHIKSSKAIPIVVINKIDLIADQSKRLGQIKKIAGVLAKQGLVTEDMGGETVAVLVSARSGEGVEDLLETIKLVWEISQEGEEGEEELRGVVIESRLDKKRGTTATVVVQSSGFSVGDELLVGEANCRVRRINMAEGLELKSVKSLSAGEAGEVLGWKQMPEVGGVIKELQRKQERPEIAKSGITGNFEQKDLDDEQKLKIVLKADTVGSLEAIREGLPVNIRVLSQGTGEISEADVFLAASGKDVIVVGFNVEAANEARKLAQNEEVLVRTYTLIYKLLEEIVEVAQNISEIKATHEILGTAKILAQFPFDKKKVAGSKVEEGRAARGDRTWLLKNQKIQIKKQKLTEKEVEKLKEEEGFLGETMVKSLRIGKDETSKVEKGGECGVLFSPQIDFELGDAIIFYRKL